MVVAGQYEQARSCFIIRNTNGPYKYVERVDYKRHTKIKSRAALLLPHLFDR